MIRYWITRNKENCCGCRACEYVCGKKAIKMEKDDEGFIFPIIDDALCVHCGKCSEVCPYENTMIKEIPKEVLIAQNKNSDILRNSSSGGIFRALADYVIKNNGYVVGCIFDKHNKANLVVSNQPNEVFLMQGSKYVFSDTNNTFKQVKQLLNNKKLVLFTGTPCQCAAIKSYLQKDYENLVIADFLCHGVPSQLMLDKYISYLSNSGREPIKNIKFRDKNYIDWGYCFSFVRKKIKYRIGKSDPYIYGFTKGYFNRINCYSCKFRGKGRVSDFTFCDFWGIENLDLELNFNINNGVSALMVNTVKGRRIKNELEQFLILIKANLRDVAVENKSIVSEKSEDIPEIRKIIYKEIIDNSWKVVEKKYLRCNYYYLRKLWYRLPINLKENLKKFGGLKK